MSDKHPHTDYVRIWKILLVLLVISVAGPFIGVKAITMITAFGIAGVKAFLVVKYFMHLNLEKRYVSYLVATALAFMGLFFAAVAPDVMKHEGQNWQNRAAQQEVARALAEFQQRKSVAAGHGEKH